MKLTIENFSQNIAKPLDAVFNLNSKPSPFAKIEAYHKALKFLPNENWNDVVDYLLIESERYPKPKEIIKAYYHINPKRLNNNQEYIDRFEKLRIQHDQIIKHAVKKSLTEYGVIYQQAIREGWATYFENVLQQIAELQMYAINPAVLYGYTLSLLPVRFDASAEEAQNYVQTIYDDVDNYQPSTPKPYVTKEQAKIIRYNAKISSLKESNFDDDSGYVGEVINKIVD